MGGKRRGGRQGRSMVSKNFGKLTRSRDSAGVQKVPIRTSMELVKKHYENKIQASLFSGLGEVYGKLANTLVIGGLAKGMYSKEHLTAFSGFGNATQKKLIDSAMQAKDKSFALKKLIEAQSSGGKK